MNVPAREWLLDPKNHRSEYGTPEASFLRQEVARADEPCPHKTTVVTALGKEICDDCSAKLEAHHSFCHHANIEETGGFCPDCQTFIPVEEPPLTPCKHPAEFITFSLFDSTPLCGECNCYLTNVKHTNDDAAASALSEKVKEARAELADRLLSEQRKHARAAIGNATANKKMKVNAVHLLNRMDRWLKEDVRPSGDEKIKVRRVEAS